MGTVVVVTAVVYLTLTHPGRPQGYIVPQSEEEHPESVREAGAASWLAVPALAGLAWATGCGDDPAGIVGASASLTVTRGTCLASEFGGPR